MEPLYDFTEFMEPLEGYNTSEYQEVLNLIQKEIKIKIPPIMTCFKQLECNDGKKISIQAGPGIHCKPKGLLPLNQYTHFEILVDENDELFFNEDLMSDSSGFIFSSVPKDIIYQYLEKHGHLKLYSEKIIEQKDELKEILMHKNNNINKQKNRI